MNVLQSQTEMSLAMLLRQPMLLSESDSLERAIAVTRSSGYDSLPVVDSWGQLVGMFAVSSARGYLTNPTGLPGHTVAELVTLSGPVLDAGGTADQARIMLFETGASVVPVVDDRMRVLGVIGAADLLCPDGLPPKPPAIGGMATPWGVYLTTGSLQAGVGNLALVGGGVALGLLVLLANVTVAVACWALQQTTSFHAFDYWASAGPGPGLSQRLGFMAVYAAEIPVFLVLMRALPLTQYHAAEHQAVHAVERYERLDADVVARMPRVHPRCGTNLMAAALIFVSVQQGLVLGAPNLMDGSDSAVVAALVSLFTWRALGAFLQKNFTTRVAGPKHLKSGIAAAQTLRDRYAASVPSQPALMRRIWCMGIVQTMAGTVPTVALGMYAIGTFINRLPGMGRYQ